MQWRSKGRNREPFIRSEWLGELIGQLCAFEDVELGEEDKRAVLSIAGHGDGVAQDREPFDRLGDEWDTVGYQLNTLRIVVVASVVVSTTMRSTLGSSRFACLFQRDGAHYIRQ